MKQFNVTGMSCAACVSRVEKAVNSLEGVNSCVVSLLTNQMSVEGHVSEEKIIQAIQDAGYGAKSVDKDLKSDAQDLLVDVTTPKMIKRLTVSVIILLPLMYVSMGHMLWNWPLPAFLNNNHISMGIYEMILSGIVMVINQKFFVSGYKGLIHKAPNMDTLVALGASASYVYSVIALFKMSSAALCGDNLMVQYYMDQFYFESAAMILTLITLGKTLESKSKGKTTNALKALMNLSPKNAVVLIDGIEKTVPIEDVKVSDLFVVKPGDSIPVDGTVVEGDSAVNESALTGESIPVWKKTGDSVSAATLNTSGHMICQATRVGEDTTLASIIKMVSDASASKAPIARIADRVSGVFVPGVIIISVITFFVWIFLGQGIGYSLARAVSVLVISCPCGLGLATPVAIMVGNGLAAKTGILFKTAASLEQAGRSNIVALDKTGTITTGIMNVVDVCPATGVKLEELLIKAYSLEHKSEHPISGAITGFCKAKGFVPEETKDFSVVAGRGLNGLINGVNVYGGNREYIYEILGSLDAESTKITDRFAAEGKTPVLFAEGDKLLGIISVADTVKEDSHAAINQLRKMGIHVCMLTGDNEITANAIALHSGVNEVIANVKPDGKQEVIRRLKEHGSVMMVGDGINDAPALTCADVGVAIGAGTDIAMDAADVVLMKNSIMDVVAAIRISRATLKNIHENLFWAFFYNIIGIPLAAGCFVKAFGWELNPMFAAAAMGLSSICVVTNALRLNFIKPYDASKDRTGKKIETNENFIIKNEKNRKDERTMKIKVKGMMCGHCEAHVKKAIEAVEGVKEAVANHEEDVVTIDTSKEIDENVIQKAVEDAGYEYIGKIE